jgi:hypothetical protein
VDFPYLSCQLARGETIAAPVEYSIGAKSRWLLGDVDHLIMRFAHRRDDQDLPAGAPSRARALLDFLKPTGGSMRHDVLNGDDPRPFFYETRQYLKELSASSTRLGRRLFDRGPQPAAQAPVVK